MMIDDRPTVEGLAIRCARLARSLLTWDDAKLALRRAIVLLDEWQQTQPDPHHVDEPRESWWRRTWGKSR